MVISLTNKRNFPFLKSFRSGAEKSLPQSKSAIFFLYGKDAYTSFRHDFLRVRIQSFIDPIPKGCETLGYLIPLCRHIKALPAGSIF